MLRTKQDSGMGPASRWNHSGASRFLRQSIPLSISLDILIIV